MISKSSEPKTNTPQDNIQIFRVKNKYSSEWYPNLQSQKQILLRMIPITTQSKTNTPQDDIHIFEFRVKNKYSSEWYPNLVRFHHPIPGLIETESNAASVTHGWFSSIFSFVSRSLQSQKHGLNFHLKTLKFPWRLDASSLV